MFSFWLRWEQENLLLVFTDQITVMEFHAIHFFKVNFLRQNTSQSFKQNILIVFQSTFFDIFNFQNIVLVKWCPKCNEWNPNLVTPRLQNTDPSKAKSKYSALPSFLSWTCLSVFVGRSFSLLNKLVFYVLGSSYFVWCVKFWIFVLIFSTAPACRKQKQTFNFQSSTRPNGQAAEDI